MDFPMCSIECIPTFLCAVLNGHNVHAKIVYNQLLLIFARLLTGEKKIDSEKVLHALIKTCCCRRCKKFIYFILYKKNSGPLVFPSFVGKPPRSMFLDTLHEQITTSVFVTLSHLKNIDFFLPQ